MKHKTKKFTLENAISPISLGIIVITLLFLFMAACHIPNQGYHGHHRDNPVRAPVIEAVKATCHYNYSYNDYVWYFDAWVHYPHYNFSDVTEVFVDVFEGGYLVDSFPLYHDREKYWTSSWLEASDTYLWCGDYYEMEFVAYDYQGNYDVFIVVPYY
jgi:hypothetical protein